jgi:hypothetical protein
VRLPSLVIPGERGSPSDPREGRGPRSSPSLAPSDKFHRPFSAPAQRGKCPSRVSAADKGGRRGQPQLPGTLPPTPAPTPCRKTGYCRSKGGLPQADSASIVRGPRGSTPGEQSPRRQLPLNYRPAAKPPSGSPATRSERGAVWLAHLSGGQGVGGSNPLAPTITRLWRIGGRAGRSCTSVRCPGRYSASRSSCCFSNSSLFLKLATIAARKSAGTSRSKPSG